MTLPSLESLPVEQRPQLARARLSVVATPLAYDVARASDGIVITPRECKRPSADDRLTPERRRHAVVAGVGVALDAYRDADGVATGLKRQRIVSPLDKLWKAGVLDANQYGSARRYQRDTDMAAMSGPGMAVKYAAHTIQGGNKPFLLPMEAQADHQRRVEAARRACGPTLQRMLDWIMSEPMSWRQQAKAWFPAASERSARIEFKRVLLLTCAALDRHYGTRRR